MKRAISVLVCIAIIFSSFMLRPSTASANSRVDIMFVIDGTIIHGSSMWAVKAEVNEFIYPFLPTSGLSFRLGLISYNYNIGLMTAGLTSDMREFGQGLGYIPNDTIPWWAHGLDGIARGIEDFDDDNASKYMIVIGDEGLTSLEGRNSDADIIQALQKKQIKVIGVGNSYSQDQLLNFASQTGGYFLDLSSDFSTELMSIIGHQAPTLEIQSPAAGQTLSDLNTIIPSVKVTDPDTDTLQISYYIDGETWPRDTRTATNTKTAQIVNFNALSVGSLNEGPHSMRYTVNDGSTETVQDSVSFVVDNNAPSLSEPAIAATATTIQLSGTATDGVSGLNVLPYRFTVGGASSGWTNLTSYTAGGLTPNSSYPVSFEAKDAVGHVGTVARTVQTDAQAPALSRTASSVTSAELSLADANPAGTAYQLRAGNLYVNELGLLTSTPTWISPTGKKVTVNGLTANTDYTFEAKARNSSGKETAFGAAINVRTLAQPPSTVTAVPEQRSIKLSWAAIPGAMSYEVEADGAVVNNGPSAAYTHSGLAPNTKHTYRVRVNNAGGSSQWSQPTVVYTLLDPPAKPSNVSIAPLQTEATVTWDAVALADSYDVEADGIVYHAGAVPSYTHKGLLAKTEHTYRVRAINAGGIGEWSAPVQTRTLPYPPLAPVGIKGKPLMNQITVSWDEATETDRYEIEVDGLIFNNGSELSYVHEGLRPLTTHTYRVRSVNSGGKSGWSAPFTMTTHPDKPVKPTSIMTMANETDITLTWYQVTHAEDYQIELDGGSIITMTDNQYVHTGLAPGSAHTYRLRAHNVSGYSEWTAPVKISTFPDGESENRSITNMAAIVTNRAITLSWDTIAKNAKYEIEVDGIMSDNGDNTTFHHGGLKANEFHTYKIRLKDGSGGRWVAVLSLSTLPDPPDAPKELKAFTDTNQIELRWDAVNGASGYDLEIDGVTVDAGTADQYIHDNLDPGTSHTYRLRAKNETGVTAWGSAITSSTTSPTYYVSARKGETFDLSLLASNVQDFSEMTFVVEYDPSQITPVDLYQYTPAADLMASGTIPGSSLDVTYKPGRITYKLKHNIVPGTSWSGEVATLTFRSAINGQAAVDVAVE
ncbi:fibronectin type III domain-containing protein [Paenibacillus kobensis]|uniref:fibronectin type III domain-containing protein n=1 Tax=Paenibacillus kobensis TaxID=59841 RepID=UPI000FDAD102|nr:fibronectin type III domain-containing protein [Paenibacillus kobensis]